MAHLPFNSAELRGGSTNCQGGMATLSCGSGPLNKGAVASQQPEVVHEQACGACDQLEVDIAGIGHVNRGRGRGRLSAGPTLRLNWLAATVCFIATSCFGHYGVLVVGFLYI